jgi:signal transduction histidine kinase
VPADLPKEVSLYLFRVAQEALHSAVKYSGVNQYRAELSATEEEIQLAVSDAGKGFDREAAKVSRGLGLMSMQERGRAVNGRFYVESKPGAGSKIIAFVPVAAGNSAGKNTSDNAANITGSA